MNTTTITGPYTEGRPSPLIGRFKCNDAWGEFFVHGICFEILDPHNLEIRPCHAPAASKSAVHEPTKSTLTETAPSAGPPTRRMALICPQCSGTGKEDAAQLCRRCGGSGGISAASPAAACADASIGSSEATSLTPSLPESSSTPLPSSRTSSSTGSSPAADAPAAWLDQEPEHRWAEHLVKCNGRIIHAPIPDGGHGWSVTIPEGRRFDEPSEDLALFIVGKINSGTAYLRASRDHWRERAELFQSRAEYFKESATEWAQMSGEQAASIRDLEAAQARQMATITEFTKQPDDDPPLPGEPQSVPKEDLEYRWLNQRKTIGAYQRKIMDLERNLVDLRKGIDTAIASFCDPQARATDPAAEKFYRRWGNPPEKPESSCDCGKIEHGRHHMNCLALSTIPTPPPEAKP